MRKILTVVAALMLCATATAQEFRSAISNVPGNEYPKVSNDMRAIVRYTSKTAKKVQVQGGDGFAAQPVDMVNDGEGNWTVELKGLTPGFHYYWFLVDGVQVNDPASVAYFGYSRPTSGIYAATPGECPVRLVCLRLYWLCDSLCGLPGAGADVRKLRHYPVHRYGHRLCDYCHLVGSAVHPSGPALHPDRLHRPDRQSCSRHLPSAGLSGLCECYDVFPRLVVVYALLRERSNTLSVIHANDKYAGFIPNLKQGVQIHTGLIGDLVISDHTGHFCAEVKIDFVLGDCGDNTGNGFSCM